MSSFFHHQWGDPSGVHHEHDARPSSQRGNSGDQTFASWMGGAGDNLNYGDTLQHSQQGHYEAVQHDANVSHYGNGFGSQQEYVQTPYAPQHQAYDYSGYHASTEINRAHHYGGTQQPMYELTIPPPPPPPPPVIPNPPPAPPQRHDSTKTGFAHPESNLKDSSSVWGEWQERERYVAAALGVHQQEPANLPSQDHQQQQYFEAFRNEGRGSQHEKPISSSASQDVPAWSTRLASHTDIGTQHTSFPTEKPPDDGSGSSQVAALSALNSLSRLESKWNKKDCNSKRKRSARRRKNSPARASAAGGAAPGTQLRTLSKADVGAARRKASEGAGLDLKMSTTQVRRVSGDDADEEEGEIKVEAEFNVADNPKKNEARSPLMDTSTPKATTDEADDDDMDLGSSDEDSAVEIIGGKQEVSAALTKVSNRGAIQCGGNCVWDTSSALSPVVARDQNRAAPLSASTIEAIRLAKDAAMKKKQNENREKQIWIDLIKNAISTAPPYIRPRLQQLAARKNIPRKKKAFTNYMNCCLTEKNMDIIARCWEHLVACRDANPIETPSKLPEVIDLTESPAEQKRSVRHVAPSEFAVGSEAGALSMAVSRSSTADVVVIPSSNEMTTADSAGAAHATKAVHPDAASVSRSEPKRKRPLASDLFTLSPQTNKPLVLSDVSGSARKDPSDFSGVGLENESKPIDEGLLIDVSEKPGQASAPKSVSRSIPPSGKGVDTANSLTSLVGASTVAVNVNEPANMPHNSWLVEERDAMLSKSNSLQHKEDISEKREKVVVSWKDNDAGRHVLNARSKVLESLRKKALLKKRDIGPAETVTAGVGSCGSGVSGGARMRDNVPKAAPDSYTLISSVPLPPSPPPQEITALSQRVVIRNISKTGPPARVRILGAAKVAPRNKIVKRDRSKLAVHGTASSLGPAKHDVQAATLQIEKARQKSEELQKNLATLKKRLAAKVKEKKSKKEPSTCAENNLERASGGSELGVGAPGTIAYDEPLAAAEPTIASMSALPASPDDGYSVLATTKRPLMPANSDVVENLRKRQKKLRQEIDMSNLKNMVKKQQDLLRKQKSKLKESKRLLEECNEEVEHQCTLVRQGDEQLYDLEKRRALMNGMLLKATKRLLSARKKLNEERLAHARMGKG